MRITNNTILITGGATGIGYAMAEFLLEKGNEVIICGRREDKLLEAKEKCSKLHIKVCDVSNENDRNDLVSWVTSNFKDFNILINNAGIQRDIDFRKGAEDLFKGTSEVRVNVEAPIYLTGQFIPFLKEKNNAAIINISSVLAFVPMARVPVYCATKAFIHSLSLSLRHQLVGVGIKIFEVMPPRIATELNIEGRRALGYKDSGITTQEFIPIVMKGLENDEYEIEFEVTGKFRMASRDDLDKMFQSINNKTFSW